MDWAKIFQGQVKIRSLQRTNFEPGRVTAQHVILLLPNLIDNIYFVICIGLIQSYFKTLTSYSVTIDTTGWLLLYQHTDVLLVYSYMLCRYKPFSAIMVLVVTPIFPGGAGLSTRGCCPLSQHRAENSIHHYSQYGGVK